MSAGHNAFLAGAATAASPGGDGVWADTLAVANGAVLACEAEAVEGKLLHEFLNLDDKSFDWVKGTAAEGVPAGYPVPAWYDK